MTIKLVKSVIGANKNQKRIVESLGLFKIGKKTEQPDNQATRGKIAKIAHLIEVS